MKFLHTSDWHVGRTLNGWSLLEEQEWAFQQIVDLAIREQVDGVIIAGAGLAAHLPGVIASKTVLPVIGVTIKAAVEGLDALFSIVQMPKSIPVATVAINNSYNAGMLAVEILAVGNKDLRGKLLEFRKEMKEDFKKNIHVEL